MTPSMQLLKSTTLKRRRNVHILNGIISVIDDVKMVIVDTIEHGYSGKKGATSRFE